MRRSFGAHETRMFDRVHAAIDRPHDALERVAMRRYVHAVAARSRHRPVHEFEGKIGFAWACARRQATAGGDELNEHRTFTRLAIDGAADVLGRAYLDAKESTVTVDTRQRRAGAHNTRAP